MAAPSTLHRSLELAGTLPALMVAAERVAGWGGGMRPISGRLAVRRVAETLLDEDRDTSRTLPSLPPLVPLPAHGTIVLVSDWLDPLDKIEAMVRHYASAGVRGHLV